MHYSQTEIDVAKKVIYATVTIAVYSPLKVLIMVAEPFIR
nr:MAG TPA: hypothetical protein [Caudoviricetes sp.]